MTYSYILVAEFSDNRDTSTFQRFVQFLVRDTIFSRSRNENLMTNDIYGSCNFKMVKSFHDRYFRLYLPNDKNKFEN